MSRLRATGRVAGPYCDPNDQEAAVTSSDTGPAPVDGRPAEEQLRARLRELDGLDARPLEAHAPAYEALHDHLQAVLADIEGA